MTHQLLDNEALVLAMEYGGHFVEGKRPVRELGTVKRARRVSCDDNGVIEQTPRGRADATVRRWIGDHGYVVEPVTGYGLYTHLVLAPAADGAWDYHLAQVEEG